MGRISYTQGPGQWGQLISQHNSDTGQSHYYGFDHANNARFLSDSGGSVTDSYSYKAFGEETVATGTTANSMRYGGEVGYYRDKIERVYVRARYYEPPSGLWLSRDPLGFDSGDVNFYRYVGNNPISIIDPSGEMPPVALAGCIVFAGCASALVAACSDCGTDVSCWGDCLTGTIQHLPPWAKFMCGGSASVCLCAIAKARGAAKPPAKPPTTPTNPKPPGSPRSYTCHGAYVKCRRYANGDDYIDRLCSLAYAECILTKLPVIFPDGTKVPGLL